MVEERERGGGKRRLLIKWRGEWCVRRREKGDLAVTRGGGGACPPFAWGIN